MYCCMYYKTLYNAIQLTQIRTKKGEMAAITRNLLNPGCFCLIRSAVRKIDVQGSTSKHATYIHQACCQIEIPDLY